MSYNPLFIDIHALQTVPPSCINRDDTGSPKTARFGGVRRARVSSQAWKKAIRNEFSTLLAEDEIGQRTKRVVEFIAQYLKSEIPEADQETIERFATDALKATGIQVKNKETTYLVFVSPRQAEELAKLAAEAYRSDVKINAKQAKAILNAKERPTLNSVDIALFGRMVADAPDLNVDATAQVAHALGVGVSEPEFDYYTAMDDRSPEDTAGAGMIGTVEYLSATLYRYATVDVYHLCENLGSVQATKKAIEAFLRAFVTSMPTGKQNTFANRTLPAAVVVQVRDTQPVSLVGAFERPVYASENHSVTELACKRLVAQETAIDEAFGTHPIQTFVTCGAPAVRECLDGMEGTVVSLSDAVSGVVLQVEKYLSGCGFAIEG
jgi:CRISPR system Cascade subunit CasC